MVKAIIIDDEHHCIDALVSDLSKNCGNVEVVAKCPSAKEGILSIKKHKPQLIFLDVEMPGQSGLELCVKIRETTLNRTTPVVFVTAHSDFGSRAQSTLSGGNDFIAKPFLLVELAVKALTWLFKEGAPSRSPAQRSASTRAALSGPKESVPQGDTQPHEPRAT